MNQLPEHGITMRLITAMALMVIPCTAPAQAFVRLSGGITASTDLTEEVIVTPISQRQSIAPTGQAVVGWRFDNGYRLALEARYAGGNLEVHDGSISDNLGRLATLQLAAMIDGALRQFAGGALRWEAAVGVLKYQPEHSIGVFSDDDPSRLLIGGGVSWTKPISPRFALVAAARYDFHTFSSRRLSSEDYTGSQGVHRLGLTLGLERSFR